MKRLNRRTARSQLIRLNHQMGSLCSLIVIIILRSDTFPSYFVGARSYTTCFFFALPPFPLYTSYATTTWTTIQLYSSSMFSNFFGAYSTINFNIPLRHHCLHFVSSLTDILCANDVDALSPIIKFYNRTLKQRRQPFQTTSPSIRLNNRPSAGPSAGPSAELSSGTKFCLLLPRAPQVKFLNQFTK